MDFTFEQLVSTLTSRFVMFQITKPSEHHVVFKASGYALEYHYQYCENITKTLQNAYGVPCIAYRKQQLEGNKLNLEVYEVIRLHCDSAVKMICIIKSENEICEPIIEWCRLDEGWYHDGDCHHEGLEDFQQSFIDEIFALPEFRLYAVTGMLEGDRTL